MPIKAFAYKDNIVGGNGGGGGGQTYTAGEHITISPANVISSDQAETMTYAQYQALSTAQKNDGTIRCITDYPSTTPYSYDPTNKAIVIMSGTVTYDSQNKALIL